MSTTPVIDIDTLLSPIPGDNPSGRSLKYEPEYDAIRETRRADEDLKQGAWQRELKTADWEGVRDLCVDCLSTKTKDLQIAAWLTEALIHLHGFAGLRDGLTVLKGIQERFWETYYPEIEDGDLDSRVGPFLFLNEPAKGLPFLIRSTPLTHGSVNGERYNYLNYHESRETENAIRKDPENESKIAAGRLRAKQFDDAVAQTPKAFYVQIVDEVKACLQAFKAFDEDTDQRFGRDAPSLLNVSKALDDCSRLLDPILAAKRQAEPDPEPEVESTEADPEASAEDATETDGQALADGTGVPRRLIRTGTALGQDALDYGRVLIEFREKAQALAEIGARLTENRAQYNELLAQLKQLDDEYDELSRIVSRNQECYQLLSRLLKI